MNTYYTFLFYCISVHNCTYDVLSVFIWLSLRKWQGNHSPNPRPKKPSLQSLNGPSEGLLYTNKPPRSVFQSLAQWQNINPGEKRGSKKLILESILLYKFKTNPPQGSTYSEPKWVKIQPQLKGMWVPTIWSSSYSSQSICKHGHWPMMRSNQFWENILTFPTKPIFSQMQWCMQQ